MKQLFEYIYIKVISANWNKEIRKAIIFRKKKKENKLIYCSLISFGGFFVCLFLVAVFYGEVNILINFCKTFWNKFIPSVVLNQWGYTEEVSLSPYKPDSVSHSTEPSVLCFPLRFQSGSRNC